jgi:hypothetical protein
VTVKVAALSLLVAGVLTLALAGLGAWAISDLRDSADRLMDLDPTHTAAFVATDYADGTETVLMVIVGAIGAILAVAYLLVARSVWKGSNWPRVVSPFLAVMSLPALFLGYVAVLIVLAGVAAAGALWMSPARAFAAERRRA